MRPRSVPGPAPGTPPPWLRKVDQIMKRLGTIPTLLAALLGFGALASDAAAFPIFQCDSSIWVNDQRCRWGTDWFATTVTSSSADHTAHSISLAMPAGGGGTGDNSRFAGAIALDGNGHTIPGGNVGSVGPTSLRTFTTTAAAPPRRLRVFLDTVRNTPEANTLSIDDVWGQTLNDRTLSSSGS